MAARDRVQQAEVVAAAIFVRLHSQFRLHRAGPAGGPVEAERDDQAAFKLAVSEVTVRRRNLDKRHQCQSGRVLVIAPEIALDADFHVAEAFAAVADVAVKRHHHLQIGRVIEADLGVELPERKFTRAALASGTGDFHFELEMPGVHSARAFGGIGTVGAQRTELGGRAD